MPDFIPLWALVLGGVYWITNRREEVAEAEAEDMAASKEEDEVKIKVTFWKVVFCLIMLSACTRRMSAISTASAPSPT